MKVLTFVRFLEFVAQLKVNVFEFAGAVYILGPKVIYPVNGSPDLRTNGSSQGKEIILSDSNSTMMVASIVQKIIVRGRSTFVEMRAISDLV